MSEVRVRRRKYELLEFVEIEGLVKSPVVLLDNGLCVIASGTQVVLVHKVKQLINTNVSIAVDINHLEELHRAEVRVSGEVLSSQFNLKRKTLVAIYRQSGEYEVEVVMPERSASAEANFL